MSMSMLTFFPPSPSKPTSSSLPSLSLLRRRFIPPQNHHRHLLHLLSSSSRCTLRCCSSSMPLQQISVSTSHQFRDSLFQSRAFWVSKSVIAWNVDIGTDGSCFLYASQPASLYVTDSGVQGHDVEINLEKYDGGLPEDVIAKFPHIRGYRAFKVPPGLDTNSLLKCQLAVVAFGSDGKCSNATGLQLPGILDELFSYDGPLGAHYCKDAVSLYLWAPTAQDVQVCIYRDPLGKKPDEIGHLMVVNGVWSIKGPKDWEGCYYVYEVSVYHPSTSHIEKCCANDPYARGYAGCLSLSIVL